MHQQERMSVMNYCFNCTNLVYSAKVSAEVRRGKTVVRELNAQVKRNTTSLARTHERVLDLQLALDTQQHHVEDLRRSVLSHLYQVHEQLRHSHAQLRDHEAQLRELQQQLHRRQTNVQIMWKRLKVVALASLGLCGFLAWRRRPGLSLMKALPSTKERYVWILGLWLGQVMWTKYWHRPVKWTSYTSVRRDHHHHMMMMMMMLYHLYLKLVKLSI